MSQTFGYNINFGFAVETTYGTRVSPTNWVEIISESVKLDQSPIAVKKLNSAGEDSYVLSKQTVGGAVEACVPYQGMEQLFKALTAGTPTSTQQGATAAYKHVFTLADRMPTGLSLEMDRDASAAGTSYAYTGCMISALTLTQDTESNLISSWEFLGKAESKVSASTPTFPSQNGIDWTQVSTATFGGSSVDAMVSEFKIENPLAEDRYKLGDRTRKGLGRGDTRKVSGKVTLEFDSVTEYDLFRDSTETAIIMEWVGGVADSTENYKFNITIPRAIFSGSTPNAGDTGPLSMDMTFMGFTGTSDEDAITISINNLLTSIA